MTTTGPQAATPRPEAVHLGPEVLTKLHRVSEQCRHAYLYVFNDASNQLEPVARDELIAFLRQHAPTKDAPLYGGSRKRRPDDSDSDSSSDTMSEESEAFSSEESDSSEDSRQGLRPSRGTAIKKTRKTKKGVPASTKNQSSEKYSPEGKPYLPTTHDPIHRQAAWMARYGFDASNQSDPDMYDFHLRRKPNNQIDFKSVYRYLNRDWRKYKGVRPFPTYRVLAARKRKNANGKLIHAVTENDRYPKQLIEANDKAAKAAWRELPGEEITYEDFMRFMNRFGYMRFGKKEIQGRLDDLARTWRNKLKEDDAPKSKYL